MTTQQFTFEEHDKLRRESFATYLFSLIQHRNEYRRPDSSNAFSIAIDATYGAGKTRFLHMFQAMEQSKDYKIVYYSAWEFDLYDDAISPLLDLISKSHLFRFSNAKETTKNAAVKALNILKTIGISYLSGQAKAHFGSEYTELIDDIKEVCGEDASISSVHDIRTKCIEKIRSALNTAARNKPLVFIVDELDRCKPSFAINTLEVLKHLLNVDNVVFLIALDMRQLCSSVHHVYGQNIDADEYVLKLFDYCLVLPAPYSFEYIHYSFHQIDKEITSQKYPNLYNTAYMLLREGGCSLRFIDTLHTTYKLMWNAYLKNYLDYVETEDNHKRKDETPLILYYFALFLKMKHPQVFKTVTQSRQVSNETKQFLREISHNSSSVESFIRNCNYEIATSSTLSYNYNGKGYDDKIEICDTAYPSEDSTVRVMYGSEMMNWCEIHLDKKAHVHHIMFRSDILNFHKYRRLTFGQFIHRQLEMYNPIRSENPESDTPTT